MYDSKKKCSVCDWANVYDSKDDFRHMETQIKCPDAEILWLKCLIIL
jgi:hypothetical protein